MPGPSTGSGSFESDPGQMLEKLQLQRSSLLGSLVDIHFGLSLLASVEANRLSQEKGPDDPRVRWLRERSVAATDRVNALSVAREIAAIRIPPQPPPTGALIQGRITDATQRAAGRVSVQLVNNKGRPVAGVEAVETDDSGYYAFQLKPETVAAVGSNAKLNVLVRSGDKKLVPAAAQAVTIAPGASVLQSVALNATELERLRLRAPFVARTTTVMPQTGVATAAKTVAQPGAAADTTSAAKPAPAKAALRTAPAKPPAKKAPSGKSAAGETPKPATKK